MPRPARPASPDRTIVIARQIALVLALSICGPNRARAQEEGGDAVFDGARDYVAAENRTEIVIREKGERLGWNEVKSSVRFGGYAFSVTQRLDPEKRRPPSSQKWGDCLLQLRGKKPARYMSSNWGPFRFLKTQIVLDGEKKPLADPTAHGVLEYLTIRDADDERIVAEGVFRDARGGFLRIGFVGWPDADLFGCTFRYFPPEGKTIERITYSLLAYPYDYADRGYWNRKRWITTPVRDTAASNGFVADLADEWRMVLHNRFAQNTAGCLLAADTESVRRLALREEGNGITVDVEPLSTERDTLLVLGDWVYRPYRLEAADFFETRETTARLIDRMRNLQAPLPRPLDRNELAEIARLIAAYPPLAKSAGDKIAAHEKNSDEWLKLFREKHNGVFTPEALISFFKIRDERRRLLKETRAEWVRAKLFRD